MAAGIIWQSDRRSPSRQEMPDVLARAAVPSFPLLTTSGAPRRVGVEVEFLGLSARRAAEVVAHRAGGFVAEEDPHAFRIRNSFLGELAVETDMRHLHPGRHQNLAIPRLPPTMAAWLGRGIAPFVPRELITSPLAIDQLPAVDGLIAALRQAGARGRGAVLFESLSLHFNVDPPALDARTLTAYLKAFMLVDSELRREVARGWRQAAVLPPDYPAAYRRLVLDDRYWPDLAGFVADYLAANPTRKRPLDFLPVLAVLAPEQVHGMLPHEKIGARPVLHYRLPQAHVGEPGWSIMPDWNRWLRVESRASDLLSAGNTA
jgi:hypothetical protein